MIWKTARNRLKWRGKLGLAAALVAVAAMAAPSPGRTANPGAGERHAAALKFKVLKSQILHGDAASRRAALSEMAALAASDPANAGMYRAWMGRAYTRAKRFGEACETLRLNAEYIEVEHPTVWIDAMHACRQVGRQQRACLSAERYLRIGVNRELTDGVRVYHARNCVSFSESGAPPAGSESDAPPARSTDRAAVTGRGREQGQDRAGAPPPVGSYAIDVASLALRDEKRSYVLADFKQHDILLLHFWASWCLPCIKELPSLRKFMRSRAYRRYVEAGVGIVPISEDFDVPSARNFIERRMSEGIVFKPYLDNDNRIVKALSRRNGYELPLTFAVDRKTGRVLARIGSINWQSAEARAFIDGAVREAKRAASAPQGEGDMR